MWARWVLAIGLGAVMFYLGLVHGVLRQDITRTSDSGSVEHLGGPRAIRAGAGIAVAGLALIVLGAITALAWKSQLLNYALWAIIAAGVATFFLSLRGRTPTR